MFSIQVKQFPAIRILLPFLLLVLFSFISSDSNILSYRFLPGQYFRLNEFSSQKIKQNMMGKEQSTSIETRIDYIFRMVGGSQEDYLLDLEMDSIWLKMNISGELVEGNSNRSQIKPGILSRSLMEITKKHLKVHITPAGQVLSVTGADTMFHVMVDSYKQIPEQVRTALKESLDQRFGNETLQLELNNLLNIYTSKPVKLGSKWQTSVSLSSGLPAITQNSWIASDISNGTATLTCEGKIAAVPKNDFQKMNGVMMKYELSGNKSASYKTDQMSGWIRTAEINENISGIVRMPGTPAMKEGISWPISMEWMVHCTGTRLR